MYQRWSASPSVPSQVLASIFGHYVFEDAATVKRDVVLPGATPWAKQFWNVLRRAASEVEGSTSIAQDLDFRYVRLFRFAFAGKASFSDELISRFCGHFARLRESPLWTRTPIRQCAQSLDATGH